MTPSGINQKILFGYAKAAEKLGAYFSLYRSAIPIDPIQDANFITITQMSASVSWDYMKASSYGNAVYNACLDAQAANAPNSCIVGDYLVPTVGSDAQYSIVSIDIVNPGQNYNIGDRIILNSGRCSSSTISLVVTNTNLGMITEIEIIQSGIYSAPLPSNPISQYYTSGAGINATFNITWSLVGSGIDDDNIYYVQSLQFDLPPRVVQCNKNISIIRPSQVTGSGYVGYVGYTEDTSEPVVTNMPASVLIQGGGNEAKTNLPTDTKQPALSILIPNLGNVMIRIDDIVVDEKNQQYVIDDNELTDLGWRIRAIQVVNSR